MGNKLKLTTETHDVKYILVLKHEEYSTEYTEIPLSYAPGEDLIKALLKLSKYHYAKVTQVTEDIVEYTYGESEVQKVPNGVRFVNNYHNYLLMDNLCTANPKDVAKAISDNIFENINQMGDKF